MNAVPGHARHLGHRYSPALPPRPGWRAAEGPAALLARAAAFLARARRGLTAAFRFTVSLGGHLIARFPLRVRTGGFRCPSTPGAGWPVARRPSPPALGGLCRTAAAGRCTTRPSWPGRQPVRRSWCARTSALSGSSLAMTAPGMRAGTWSGSSLCPCWARYYVRIIAPGLKHTPKGIAAFLVLVFLMPPDFIKGSPETFLILAVGCHLCAGQTTVFLRDNRADASQHTIMSAAAIPG